MVFTPHYTRKARGGRNRTMRSRSSKRVINLTELAPLFEGISGFNVSTGGLEMHKTTYGEVMPEGIRALDQHFSRHTPLKDLKADQRTFYDLGCGVGKVVIGMAMLHPEMRSVGVEIVPDRIQLANKALERVKQKNVASRCKFILGSIFDPQVNLSDAGWIYISNLCFENDIQEKLAEKIEAECRPGCLIACSKAIPFKDGEKVHLMEQGLTVPMSWSADSKVYLYRVY